MIFLSFTLLFQETFSFQHTFHRTQTNICSLFFAEMMNHLTAASVLETEIDDCINGRLIHDTRMGSRTGALGRNDHATIVWSTFDPLADGARSKAGVTGNLTHRPALPDKLYCLHPKAWKMGIRRIWHSEEEYRRCFQAIEPLRDVLLI